MSEEILKALTQLFAIITKQDVGTSELERDFVIQFFQQQLAQDDVKEYLALYDEFAEYNKPADEESVEITEEGKKKKLTSVKDSVKTLGICKKINKTLTQKQKFITLVKILELVAAGKNFTPQRMQIIDTVSEVFNIKNEDFKIIESFVLHEDWEHLDFADILISDHHATPPASQARHIEAEKLEGRIVVLWIRSEEMYFVKYAGDEDVNLSGFRMVPRQIYLFSPGSIIKTASGQQIYYSDVATKFKATEDNTRLSFNVHNLEFRFPNGVVGLRNINLSEKEGTLVAIMGGSGAGKTTLLNVLAGLETPSQGEVLLNGLNLHTENDRVKGFIGYIAQDDLLMEELSVFQNLYYNAKLCFRDLPEEELVSRVHATLDSLGLLHIKDITVGNVLNKKISGGQRKRLNIALELIREPAVLFVDEPTSGLSSRDSENVIDLLKELSLKGKLIFVVIHQPSSDIFKAFDRLFLMDTGGYPIFYGNPVDSVTYFKRCTHQIDAERGQCPTCGNINPEQLFNIVEAQVVDEYGQFTGQRKVTSRQWNEQFLHNFTVKRVEDQSEVPASILRIPGRLKQFWVFTLRDTLSKLANSQYMTINLLEAPLLAFLLSYVIRFKNSPQEGEYLFRFNENIPAFVLICVIVALFMGLTVSAEEIIRDRKIQRREKFLNLSRTSYLFSKVSILFTLSAIQTLSFVLIGNWILDIPDMTLTYWLVLFSTSCFANMLGLNISSAFNSAVTIYIIIPLLLIPQMILSGAIFNFDKLNDTIAQKGRVPLLADLMTSRWAFEAITVNQFTYNKYQRPFFSLEKTQSIANYHATYLIPELQKRLNFTEAHYRETDKKEEVERYLIQLRYHLTSSKFSRFTKSMDVEGLLNPKDFNFATAERIRAKLSEALDYYSRKNALAGDMIDSKMAAWQAKHPDKSLIALKNTYYNDGLADLLKNSATKTKILDYGDRMLQQIDPIYTEPEPLHALDYRSHFFAPHKYLAGLRLDTYVFNILVIWFMSAFLYVALYFEWLRRGIERLGVWVERIARWPLWGLLGQQIRQLRPRKPAIVEANPTRKSKK